MITAATRASSTRLAHSFGTGHAVSHGETDALASPQDLQGHLLSIFALHPHAAIHRGYHALSSCLSGHFVVLPPRRLKALEELGHKRMEEHVRPRAFIHFKGISFHRYRFVKPWHMAFTPSFGSARLRTKSMGQGASITWCKRRSRVWSYAWATR